MIDCGSLNCIPLSSKSVILLS